jgi:hypothetical protein
MVFDKAKAKLQTMCMLGWPENKKPVCQEGYTGLTI